MTTERNSLNHTKSKVFDYKASVGPYWNAVIYWLLTFFSVGLFDLDVLVVSIDLASTVLGDVWPK